MKAISLLVLLAMVACSSRRQPEDPYHFLQAPLLAKVPEMRECYTNTSNYLKNQDAEIKTKIEFELQLDGSTTDHKIIDSSLKDEKFNKCMISKLQTLKYPPQKESIVITQTFNFYPRKP